MIKNLQKFRKVFSNLFRIESLIERNQAIQHLKSSTLNSNHFGINTTGIVDKPVIVSLTTYGQKIYDVYLTIESLLNQTQPPNRIVLWLSEKHFTLENLPISLHRQMQRGLEVRFCKDIGPYTKLIPSLSAFPNAVIITVDDDIIYPMDMVENFVRAYREDPLKIHFNRGHVIRSDARGEIMPYLKWCEKGHAAGSSLYNFPLGVYGVLYPSGCFHENICRDDIFLNLCPYADDVWFKAMSLAKGVECKCIESYSRVGNNFISIETNTEKALARTNVDNGMNDVQIEKVFDLYGLKDLLFRE